MKMHCFFPKDEQFFTNPILTYGGFSPKEHSPNMLIIVLLLFGEIVSLLYPQGMQDQPAPAVGDVVRT